MRNRQIVVIGSSDDNTTYFNEAYEIGRFIAERGYTLITGGRGGIMEAVSKGAWEYNGNVIGILPDDDLNNSNAFCNTVIATGIGFARNSINILSADIVIAIGGKAGTLSELAYAWIYNKPVIYCTFTQGWSREFPDLRIDDRIGGNIYKADDVEGVKKYLQEFFV